MNEIKNWFKRFISRKKCDLYNPCGKIVYKSIIKECNVLGIVHYVYKHFNCENCRPFILPSSVEDRERSKREDSHPHPEKEKCLNVDIETGYKYCSIKKCEKDHTWKLREIYSDDTYERCEMRCSEHCGNTVRRK